MSFVSESYANLLQYGMQSPIEFGMLQGFDSMDPSTWTDSQDERYLKWASAKMEQPTQLQELFDVTHETSFPYESKAAELEAIKNMRLGSDFVRTTNDASAALVFSEEYEGREEIDAVIRDFYNQSDSSATSLSAQTSSDFTNLGDRGTIDLGPSTSTSTTRSYLGSVTDEGSYADYRSFMESEEIPPEIFPRGKIKPFRTSGSGATANLSENTMSNNVTNLEDVPEVPDMPIQMLREAGLDDTQITNVLEDSFQGMNALGNPMFDLSTILHGVQGAVTQAVAIGPFLNYIRDNWGPIGVGAYYTVNITGAIKMLLEADPIAWGTQMLMTLAQQTMKQQANIRENDYSGDLDSSRFLMVKDEGLWYPAVLVNRTKGEGMFDQSNTIEVRYGNPEDMFIKFEDGSNRVHFRHQKNRQFRMMNDEWTGEKSTLEWSKDHDPLRQFYFLSSDEQNNILKSYATDDYAWSTIQEDDNSEYTPFMENVTDFAKTLDFIQNQERKSGDPSTFMVSESKGFRDAAQIALVTGSGTFQDPTWQHATGGVGIPPADQRFGIDSDYDSYVHPGKPGAVGMQHAVSEIVPRQMKKLEASRTRAAISLHLSPATYLDLAKALPPAKSYEELQAQYLAIDNYTDRTEIQKDYLRSKSATRYEMNYISDMGFGAELYNSLVRVTDWNTTAGSGYKTDKGILPNQLDSHRTEQGYYMLFDNPYNNIPAWLNEKDGHLEEVFPAWMTIDSWQRGILENDQDESGEAASATLSGRQALLRFGTASVTADNESGVLDKKNVHPGDPDDFDLGSPDDRIYEEGLKTRAVWVAGEQQRRELLDPWASPGLEPIQEEAEMPDIADLYTAAPTTAVRVGGQEFVAGELVAELEQDEGPDIWAGVGPQFKRGHQPYTSQKADRVKQHPEMSGEKAWLVKQQAKEVQSALPLAERDTAKGRFERNWYEKHTIAVAATQKEIDDEQATNQNLDNRLYGARGQRKAVDEYQSGDLIGQKITYDNLKGRLNDFLFESSEVGEISVQHVIETILFGETNWFADDVPINEELLPAWRIQEQEDNWIPLMERVDQSDDPNMKNRANWIKDLVYKPTQKEYMDRYHPQQNMNSQEIAHDIAGTYAELSDDWSRPIKHHQNSVMFNHQLHTQIDLNVTEHY